MVASVVSSEDYRMSGETNVVGRNMAPATPIQYVGKTDTYLDVLYGTGNWERDQVKNVLRDVAAKMLIHRDQYVAYEQPESSVSASDEADVVGEIVDRREREDSPEQQVRDSIATMDKDALRSFIATNYRVPVDGRLSVEKLREQAVRLVDQYIGN